MMPEYEYSCFVSYKHPPVHEGSGAIRHFWMEFIMAFQARLDSYMTLRLSIYRDDQLRSKPGVNYPPALSSKLCRSVCMIAILVPEYLESSWCLAEWRAMERLEKERAKLSASDSFIIPIIYRGQDNQFDTLCGTREYCDFRGVISPWKQLNSIWCRQQIEEIACRIAELSRRKSSTDCSKFSIEAGEEVVSPRFDDPNPLM